MVKAFLSVFCHTFILKFRVTILMMWGHSTIFSSTKSQSLTKSHYFINIHLCLHSKGNGHCMILHYIYSDKFFGAFTDPILLHIATHQGIVFVTVIVFLIALLLLMDIRFSSSCVFIFYIVFSFSFCLLHNTNK